MANNLKCECGYEAKDQMDLEKHKEQKHAGENAQRQSRQEVDQGTDSSE